MEKTFNNIGFKTIVYSLNCENGYYIKQPRMVVFNKLPNDLKVEETQKDFLINQGANHIIRGRIKNGKYSFFTGLITIPNKERVYFGNDFEVVNGNKKFSLLVFIFSEDSSILNIYYFNHFYKNQRPERIEFIIDFLDSNCYV